MVQKKRVVDRLISLSVEKREVKEAGKQTCQMQKQSEVNDQASR